MEITETADLVACLTAPLADAKELLEACLDADISATLARDACCGKGGCGCSPKMQLLVPPADVPRVALLLRQRWDDLADREGLEVQAQPADLAEGEFAPCPACNTAAALKDGACSDCGLQLE